MVREQDTQRKIIDTNADIMKKLSDALLNLEKAETEDTVNQRDIYTSQFEIVAGLLQTLITNLSRGGQTNATS